MLVMIVAVNETGSIGLDGVMPWRNAEDLKHFRETTMGHTLVMGRKTYEGLPKTLDGRNIRVVSRDKQFERGVQDLEAFCIEHESTDEIIFIAGGGEIYKQCMPYTKRILMSVIDGNKVMGDTFFPSLDPKFKEIKTEAFETFTLRIFEREEHIS